MDETLKELYEHIIENSNYWRDLDKTAENEIEELYKEDWGAMGGDEYEAQRDKAFQVSAIAEEKGFIKGFQYAMKLLLGSMNFH